MILNIRAHLTRFKTTKQINKIYVEIHSSGVVLSLIIMTGLSTPTNIHGVMFIPSKETSDEEPYLLSRHNPATNTTNTRNRDMILRVRRSLIEEINRLPG